MTKESDLEELLIRHPYLIAEEFFGLKALRQLVYGKHRLDLHGQFRALLYPAASASAAVLNCTRSRSATLS